jgi:hypothetical protein
MKMVDGIENSGRAVSVALAEQVSGKAGGGTAPAEKRLIAEPLDGMMMSDDAIAQITGMLAKSYRQDRKEAHKLAQLENCNVAAELRKRVAELHEKANDIGKAAMISGLTQIGAGATQIFGATATFWAPGQGAAQGAAADNWRLGCEGSAGVMKGGGELGAGIYREDAEHCEANAAQHEGNAEAAKRRGDEYRNEADDAKRMLEKVAEFLKEVRSSQQSAASSALYKA